MVSMANTIERIPDNTRWEIATKSLTGAYIAISNALKQAVGQSKFEELNGPLWRQAGKGAKEFAAALGLATETAGDDTCGARHQAWGEGATESLNPNFTFKLTKNMLHGDSHCEWVIERKR